MNRPQIYSVRNLFEREEYWVEVCRYFIDHDGGVRSAFPRKYHARYTNIKRVERLIKLYLKLEEMLLTRNLSFIKDKTALFAYPRNK